jgi:hypothetical protein
MLLKPDLLTGTGARNSARRSRAFSAISDSVGIP